MSTNLLEAQKAYRDRSIRLAMITSIISKMGTIVLRLVSIPIAIRLLGMDLFGVYAVITMAVGMIDMMHVGIGPALTREITNAVANGDRRREKRIFVTGVLMSVILTLIAAVIAAVLLIWLPIPVLFGEKFAPLSEVMHRAAWIGLGIISIEMVCIVFEKVRDGYMETRYNNAWGAFGNILGAVSLIIGIWFFPTIEFLLLSINGSIAIAKLGNSIHFLMKRNYLIPRLRLFRKDLVKPLAGQSVRFSITYILSAMVEYNLMAFLIGRFVGPEAVGVYNVMITVHFSLTGIIVMFTNPYWPALMDAFARKDHSWIENSSRKGRLGVLAFALLTGVGLVLVGPWALPLWAGEELKTSVPHSFTLDSHCLLTFSGYFAIHVWRHLNQILALGVGQVKAVSRVVILETSLVCAFAIPILYWSRDLSAVYLTMTIVIACVSGWIFPSIFKTHRREILINDNDPVLSEEPA